jgi:hypothetical protein
MKTAEIEQLIEHAIYSTFKKSGAKTSIYFKIFFNFEVNYYNFINKFCSTFLKSGFF